MPCRSFLPSPWFGLGLTLLDLLGHNDGESQGRDYSWRPISLSLSTLYVQDQTESRPVSHR